MKKYLLKQALNKGYAIGAFNFASLEVLKAIISAAQAQKSPVIAQISESAMNFIGDDYLKGIIETTRKKCSVPVSFHLDHGKSLEVVKRAIAIGCDSVMIDASMLPYEDNVKITKKVVSYAHKHNVFVEAELGSLAGIEDDIKVKEENSFYTSPSQAKDFVQRTGVDSLAIAIGTKHGAYKYNGESKLRFDILRKIEKELPNTPLVLHGGSGVDKDDVDALFNLGVDIRGAKGVSDAILKKISKTNICKINGDTDLRISYLLGIEGCIQANKSNIDYRKYLSNGMSEVARRVASKMEIYGCKGKAAKNNCKKTAKAK